MSIVPQDVFYLAEPFGENIAYGKPDATQEEIMIGCPCQRLAIY
jgi:ABC-type multidrug transport system fused ATPase/permease subunit